MYKEVKPKAIAGNLKNVLVIKDRKIITLEELF